MQIENVRDRGGKSGLVIGLILAAIGMGIGFGFGSSNVGRRFHNQANSAAKAVKAELDGMQKTVSQIGTAAAMSQQRLQAAKQDSLAYDPQLIADLEKVKVDPRPDTGRIFKVNYFLLSDLAVDRLMNYYYDSLALYGEVERHVKRTKADAESLATYAEKQSAKGGNYGIVFDNAGRLVVGNLVEVGKPVCKGGNDECGADAVEGFQIRANTGSNWSARKAGSKLSNEVVVPLKPTPLMETVMSGSPEQVRMEAYRQRYTNIRIILARMTATQKELKEAIDKAAGRADLMAF